MEVVGLDLGRDLVQIQRAVGLELDGLRLDRAEHRASAALVLVGVGVLAHQVLVAPGAVRQQGQEVGLGPRGGEQGGLLAQKFRACPLQAVHGGVVAEDVVADLGFRHGTAHLG